MLLSRTNFFLSILLLFGIVALFVQTLKITRALDYNSRRIDELEKKPATLIEPATITQSPGSAVNITSLTDYIDQTLATLSGKPKPAATPKPVLSTNKQTLTYVPIFGGSFQTSSSTWVDVPGSDFQLNPVDYSSGSYMTFEALTWVIGGSGQVELRILDTNRGVIVPGSEVSLNASSSTLLTSGRLTFLLGNSTFRVQIKSQTSSPVQFDFGRIKIVY